MLQLRPPGSGSESHLGLQINLHGSTAKAFRAPQSFIHPPNAPRSYMAGSSALKESFSLEAQQHVIIKYRRCVGRPGAHQHGELECGSRIQKVCPFICVFDNQMIPNAFLSFNVIDIRKISVQISLFPHLAFHTQDILYPPLSSLFQS